MLSICAFQRVMHGCSRYGIVRIWLIVAQSHCAQFLSRICQAVAMICGGSLRSKICWLPNNLENSKFELIKRCAEIADSRMFVGFFSSCAPSVTGKILLWTRWSWGHSIPAAYMEWAHVLGADAWSSHWPVSLKSRIMPLKRDNSFPFCASDYFVVC